jgi:hypothetical protein
LLKYFIINGTIDCVKCRRVALFVDAVIGSEIFLIKNDVSFFGHIPNLLIYIASILLHLPFPMIKGRDAIKEWRLAINMIEHNLSHLAPRLLSLANGDHGSDTT